MPTTIKTFAAYQAKMRWREPYVTEGLNRKMSVAVPPGIYRGFKIEAYALANDTVRVLADPSEGDHIALFQTQDEYSLSIRDETGDFLIDFSLYPAYSGTTVVLALNGTYAAGSTTTAIVEIYTQAEYDASALKPYLIVLGTVNVPVLPSGFPIPATDVTHDQRTEAWMKMAPGSIFWTPLLKSSGFEWGVNTERAQNGETDKDGLIPYWDLLSVAAAGTVGMGSTDTTSHSGNRSLLMEMTAGPANGVGFAAIQRVNMPVTPGRKIRLSAWLTILGVENGVGTGGFFIAFVDKDGNQILPYLTVPVTLTGAIGWTKFEHTFEIPAGAAYVRDVSFAVAGAQYIIAPAPLLAIDDFQVYLENEDPWEVFQFMEKAGQPLWADPLIIGKFLNDPIFSKAGALLQMDPAVPSGEGRLVMTCRDETNTTNPPQFDQRGRVRVGAGLLDTPSRLELPRVEVQGPTGAATLYRTLLFQFARSDAGPNTNVRAYIAALPGGVHTQLEIVTNAIYDNTTDTWTREVAGHGALLYVYNAYGWATYRYPSDFASPWLTSAWQQMIIQATESIPGGGDASGAELGLGGGLLDTLTHVLRPRLSISRTNVGAIGIQRTQVLYSQAGGPGAVAGTHTVRSYRSMEPITQWELLEFALNASWDGTNWNQEDAAKKSHYISFSAEGIKVREKAAASPPWVDGGWESPLILEGSDPSNVAPYANTLTPKNVPKMWCEFSVVGGVPAITKGFNIASVTLGAGPPPILDLIFTFAQVMDSGNYAALVTLYNNLGIATWYFGGPDISLPKTAALFHITGLKSVGFAPLVTAIDWTSDNVYGSVSVFARQP